MAALRRQAGEGGPRVLSELQLERGCALAAFAKSQPRFSHAGIWSHRSQLPLTKRAAIVWVQVLLLGLLALESGGFSNGLVQIVEDKLWTMALLTVPDSASICQRETRGTATEQDTYGYDMCASLSAKRVRSGSSARRVCGL